MPKVSVIVTTYNRKEYLTETIQSILNQTYQDFELIVVDNYSNYDFFSLIESFKNEKIIPFQNQNNGVIAVNRNVGIKQAKGEFLAFCDDDDIWRLNKLEEQLSVIKSNSLIDLVSTKVYVFNENLVEGKFSDIKPSKNLTLLKLFKRNTIFFSTVLLKKESILFKFSEDPLLITAEDYQFWLKLKLTGINIYQIDECLVDYRMSDSSNYYNHRSEFYIKLIYTFWSAIIEVKEKRIKIYFIALFFTLINIMKFIKNREQ